MFLAVHHREAQPESWEFYSLLATVYSKRLVLLNFLAGQNGMKRFVSPVQTSMSCSDPFLFLRTSNCISYKQYKTYPEAKHFPYSLEILCFSGFCWQRRHDSFTAWWLWGRKWPLKQRGRQKPTRNTAASSVACSDCRCASEGVVKSLFWISAVLNSNSTLAAVSQWKPASCFLSARSWCTTPLRTLHSDRDGESMSFSLLTEWYHM